MSGPQTAVGTALSAAATTSDNRTDATGRPRSAARLRRTPLGRAAVGGLLITAAAVVGFASHLGLGAEDPVTYLVARDGLPAGTPLDDPEAVGEHFDTAAVSATGPLAERLVRAEQAPELAGMVLRSPLAAGDPLTVTQLAVATAPAGTHAMSFAVPAASAVAGTVAAGDRVDLLATTAGLEPRTIFVARDVPVLAVGANDGGIAVSGDHLVMTVALPDADTVREVTAAVHTATIALSRPVPGDQPAG